MCRKTALKAYIVRSWRILIFSVFLRHLYLIYTCNVLNYRLFTVSIFRPVSRLAFDTFRKPEGGFFKGLRPLVSLKARRKQVFYKKSRDKGRLMIQRIFFICCVVVLSAINAMADVGAEIYGANVNIFDAESQLGGGGSLFVDINSDFKALARGTYTLFSDEKVTPTDIYVIDYSYYSILAGLEYEPEISLLSALRLHWRNSICFGFSRTGVDVEGQKSASAGDSGFAMAFNTGISFDVTRHFQVFLETGWHHSFYDGEFKDSRIYGVQVLAGARFAIFGSRGIEYDY